VEKDRPAGRRTRPPDGSLVIIGGGSREGIFNLANSARGGEIFNTRIRQQLRRGNDPAQSKGERDLMEKGKKVGVRKVDFAAHAGIERGRGEVRERAVEGLAGRREKEAAMRNH